MPQCLPLGVQAGMLRAYRQADAIGFVKPQVKANNNDHGQCPGHLRGDGITEHAVGAVWIKNIEQQSVLELLLVRQRLVKARTAQADQTRELSASLTASTRKVLPTLPSGCRS